ncbi:MAG: hypothetical protein GTO63_14795, partial [Anaerolineae bacterium]|nr:hypothetical protein [Anaerolineae bacterium]NIN96117.1 hypothetical protein [Anaerolineae bacterium]
MLPWRGWVRVQWSEGALDGRTGQSRLATDERSSTLSLLGLRQLQDALHRKADQVQQEFIHLSEQLEEIGRKLLEAEDEESRRMFRSEREKLKSQQQALADEINLWRERARQVTQQSGAGSLRSFLEDLLSLEDKDLEPVVERTIYLLDAPAEELDRLSEGPEERQALTPAGRLLERA